MWVFRAEETCLRNLTSPRSPEKSVTPRVEVISSTPPPSGSDETSGGLSRADAVRTRGAGRSRPACSSLWCHFTCGDSSGHAGLPNLHLQTQVREVNGNNAPSSFLDPPAARRCPHPPTLKSGSHQTAGEARKKTSILVFSRIPRKYNRSSSPALVSQKLLNCSYLICVPF